MRYFLITLFFLSAITSYSQTKEKEYKGGGTISFDETIYVFGPVKEEGGPVSNDFKFVNTGKGPLRIKNVLTSCGCTTPKWSQDPINPGESGFIKAIFDPKNRPGHFSRTLTVITNGTPESVILTVEGDVVSGANQMNALFPGVSGNLRFTGTELVLPGIKEDKIDTVWLGVFNSTDKTIFIRNVITPLQMRVEQKTYLLAAGQGDNIMMTYNAALVKDLGQKTNDIVLLTSDDSVSAKTIKIRANIIQNFDKLTPEQRQNAPVIAFDKTEADLGELYQGETGTHTFEITNKGKSDLVIRKIYSASGAMSAKIADMTIKKGKKAKIAVSFNTKGLRGAAQDAIQLTVNDPKQPYIMLKLKAKVVIPGVEPTSN